MPLQSYAKWSQRLNVEIYVAYGEANGHATEALSNIRTVKAMSTELQGSLRWPRAFSMMYGFPCSFHWL